MSRKEIKFNNAEQWGGAIAYLSEVYGLGFDVTDGDDFQEEGRYLETMVTGSIDYMFKEAGRELKETDADSVSIIIPERMEIEVSKREGTDESDGNIGVKVTVLAEAKKKVKDDAGL